MAIVIAQYDRVLENEGFQLFSHHAGQIQLGTSKFAIGGAIICEFTILLI